MTKVTWLPCITTLDISPDTVLKAAIGKVDDVAIMGWDKNGDLYVATSFGKEGDLLMLLEKTKKFLVENS